MTLEEWRPIAGYGGGYEISNRGRVRSWKQQGGGAQGMPLAASPKVMQPQADRRNYLYVNLYLHGVMKSHRVHHLVAEAFIGARPVGMLVCHGDGSSFNNHVSNLRYDTAKGNQADRRLHGTHLEGEGHPRSRLTDDDIREIRARGDSGESFTSIALAFGVARSTAARIARRERWTHVAA